MKSQLEFLCGSHDKFEFTFKLFLNPSRIQIRTQFFCGSKFLPLLGPPYSFLPFSLSPPLLLSIALGHYRASLLSAKPANRLFLVYTHTSKPPIPSVHTHTHTHTANNTHTHTPSQTSKPPPIPSVEREQTWRHQQWSPYNVSGSRRQRLAGVSLKHILLLGRHRFAGVDMRIRVKAGGHYSQIYAIRQSIADPRL